MITNARVWTGRSEQPWAEAVAIREDRIVFVGANRDLEPFIDSGTRLVDGRGAMVTPGFNDSHIHFLEGGSHISSVQLRDVVSRADFVKRIADFAATVPAGTWITGGDWDHERWGGELPERSWIDESTPNHPVWVNRLDGHMSLANSAALKLAGVTAGTPDIEGGEIVRGADGAPTGVLKDNALGLVDRVVPPASADAQDRALDAAMSYVVQQGVTSVQHMGSWDDLIVFRRAHAAGRLRVRLFAAVPLHSWERLRDEVSARGRGDRWLRIGGLKGFVDGSLGSHTAAFVEPFSDAPSDRGLLVTSRENLYTWISGADRSELQVMTHAIGDRAIGMLLDIYERVAKENGSRDRRFRVEHAQHIAPADIVRFKALDVVASMQPYHAIDDGRWAERTIGPERIKTTYAFRSLLDAGARVAFGSDWYVAPPIPLEGIYAAVTRRTIDGKNDTGWVPAQKISVEEALKAYTTEAAYATGEQGEKGLLAAGMLADIVVLDRDLTAIPPEEIRDVKVRMTIVGGKVMYDRTSGRQ
ncbi:MAG TPA: amidohydrolase [Thermoanaerobaculia bacterium]|nr:amidohydrolase [Thermoanaerobaculia bacterium]